MCSQRFDMTKLTPRALFSFLIHALLLGSLSLAPTMASADHLEGGAESMEADPDRLVRVIVDKFKSELRKTRGKGKGHRRRIIDELIAEYVTPYTDFDHMTREIFQDHWEVIDEKGLADEALNTVSSIFHRIQINGLTAYSDQRIRIFTADVKGDQARVHMKVDAFKTFTLDMYLHLREDGHWRVYDMALIGNSFNEIMRKGFGILIERKGLEHALGDVSVRMEGEV